MVRGEPGSFVRRTLSCGLCSGQWAMYLPLISSEVLFLYFTYLDTSTRVTLVLVSSILGLMYIYLPKMHFEVLLTLTGLSNLHICLSDIISNTAVTCTT